MSLGENIHRLRTERGLSQVDLANALEVSRQSVSKWETDASVPELEKLVKMSHLFGVTLDELVTGISPRQTSEQSPETPPQTIMIVKNVSMPGRKIAGFICFGLAALVILLCTLIGGLLEGLILSVPFLMCGTICFVSRKRPGLWCTWAIYSLFSIALPYTTGLTWHTIKLTHLWQADWNYARLAIAWFAFLMMLLLIFFTVRSFRKTLVIEPTSKNKRFLLAGWLTFIIAYLLYRFVLGGFFGYFFRILFDLAMMIAFTVVLTATLCTYRHQRK